MQVQQLQEANDAYPSFVFSLSVVLRNLLRIRSTLGKAHHPRQDFSARTIGWPFLQPKAFQNSGIFVTAPIKRNFPGECGSVTISSRDVASVTFSQRLTA